MVVACAAGALAGFATPLSAQSDPYDSGGPLISEQAAYDVEYYELALRVDPADSTIDGAATLVARALARMKNFVVDLDPRLEIREVAAEGTSVSRRVDGARRVRRTPPGRTDPSLGRQLHLGANAFGRAPWIGTSCFTIPLQPGENAVADPDHWILKEAEGSP